MSCYLMNISNLFSLRKLLEISLVGFRVEKSFFRAVLRPDMLLLSRSKDPTSAVYLQHEHIGLFAAVQFCL